MQLHTLCSQMYQNNSTIQLTHRQSATTTTSTTTTTTNNNYENKLLAAQSHNLIILHLKMRLIHLVCVHFQIPKTSHKYFDCIYLVAHGRNCKRKIYPSGLIGFFCVLNLMISAFVGNMCVSVFFLLLAFESRFYLRF